MANDMMRNCSYDSEQAEVGVALQSRAITSNHAITQSRAVSLSVTIPRKPSWGAGRGQGGVPACAHGVAEARADLPVGEVVVLDEREVVGCKVHHF